VLNNPSRGVEDLEKILTRFQLLLASFQCRNKTCHPKIPEHKKKTLIGYIVIHSFNLVTPASPLFDLEHQNITPMEIVVQEPAIILHHIQGKENLQKTTHKLVIGPGLGGPRLEILVSQLIVAV